MHHAGRVQVRAAELPAEAAELTDLYLASASHHAQLDPVRYVIPDYADVLMHYEALRPDGHAHAILVAADGGDLIGVAEVGRLSAPPGWSMLRPIAKAAVDIAVAEEHRGRGVGAELLKAASSWATEHGVEALVLDTLTANERALSFYARHGYRQFGTLMERVLPL